MRVGDIVRVGKGKRTWRISGFGTWASGEEYAALEPIEVGAYTSSSAVLSRLVLVHGMDEKLRSEDMGLYAGLDEFRSRS